MTRRLALAALAVVALSGCAGTAPSDAGVPSGTPAPSPEASTSAPTTPAGRVLAVAVAGGRVTGDTGRVPVPLGERVALTVTGDVADEVHVHGYDRTAEMAPGAPATVEFTADVPGVFEVELHGTGTVLLSLQVG
ncbi:hypothetical protein ACI79J_00545 [Geodermatophilus sp. SYSU D01062]